MATITGARGTGNILSTRRKVDVADKIALLQPESAPLTAFTTRLKKKVAINPEFGWFEDDLEPRFDAVNNGAGYASGATSVVVDNGAYFAEHDLVYVTRTGEVVRVTAVSTNTLTIVRGVGSTAAALVDNDELLIIGSAQPEGDTSKPARSSNVTKVINYTQIFRKPVELTETLRMSETYGDNDWDYQVRKAGIEHNKDKEYAFIFGRKSEDTSGSQPRRTTGGALNFITTNQTDAGGALTEAEFFGALRPAFRYGSKRKIAFGSGLAIDVLNTYPRGKVQVVNQAANSYGVNAVDYVSPHGTVTVVTHWLLEGSKFGGYIIILDMDQVEYRYLKGRDSHLRTNIEAPDADTRKDEYLAECGLVFGLEKTHAVITGITS